MGGYERSIFQFHIGEKPFVALDEMAGDEGLVKFHGGALLLSFCLGQFAL